jgi:hypothetical protein
MSSRTNRPKWFAWLPLVVALFSTSARSYGAPVISSLDPNSAIVNGPAFTLTVNGSGFGGLLGTTVLWNGSARTTTFVSSTRVTAQIPASDIDNTGTAQIAVRNEGAPDQTSATVTFSILNNPVPIISSLSPTAVLQDGPDFTLTVNGSNFVSGSRVRLGGSNQNTTFVSSTQLTARIQDNAIRQPGSLSITVFNPSPGGGTSNAVTLTVTSSLTITTSSPLPAAAVGSPYSRALAAAGGLPPYSWSITTGSLPAGLALSASTGVLSGTPSTSGSFNFTVRVSDGGQPTPQTATKAFSLAVAAGAPVLTSLNPSTSTAGGPAFTLTVDGTNFVSNSTVRWNGSNRTTTFVNASQLTAAIPASDIASTGTASVTVANPGGSTSNALTFTVSPAALTITTSSPLPDGVVGVAYSQTLSATGGQPPYSWSIVAGSLPDGLALAPSTGVLSGTPSAAGSINFTVGVSDGAQPTPQTATKTLSLAVTASAPVLNSLNPGSAIAGGSDFTLTVSGSSFVSNSTVRWNGANRTTTFVSSSQLTAAIPAADIATQGTASITVLNPGPATSNALTFTISGPGLTITTNSPLPRGTVGTSYSQTFGASGGAAPYTWSLSSGSLPAGLTLNASSGILGGTPSAVGDSTFTIRVSDSASASATKQFQLSIGSTAIPTLTISGISDIVEPAQQPSLEITLASAHSSPITGQLTLKFTSNADVASDDPAIQFSTGGRSVTFSIPVNTTRAVFSNGAPNIAFQTGTVSGTIELSVSSQSGGGSATPLPPVNRILTLNRRAPAITRLIIASRSTSGFELAITGFSTPRSLTRATFLFTPAQGANLETSTVTLTLGPAAANWFQSQTGTSLGGQFRLSMPFTVQGEVSAIQSVTVTLTNGEGTSAASSVQF